MNQKTPIIGILGTLVLSLMLSGTAYSQTVENSEKASCSTSADKTTETCVYKITGLESKKGMRCEGCVHKVKTALNGVKGVVEIVAIDLEAGTTTVTLSKDSNARDNIPKAIELAGFIATPINIDENKINNQSKTKETETDGH